MSGEGEDEFRFRLSREEFLDFFFEDLALPDLVKTQLDARSPHHRRVRAGYTHDGTPANLAIVRTMRESLARRIAFQGPQAARLRELEAELEALGGDAADRDDPQVAACSRSSMLRPAQDPGGPVHRHLRPALPQPRHRSRCRSRRR